jgi:hypothetical protein
MMVFDLRYVWPHFGYHPIPRLNRCPASKGKNASTATVRKAAEQVNNVFMRRVAVFPPHGLDVTDNFFFDTAAYFGHAWQALFGSLFTG